MYSRRFSKVPSSSLLGKRKISFLLEFSFSESKVCFSSSARFLYPPPVVGVSASKIIRFTSVSDSCSASFTLCFVSCPYHQHKQFQNLAPPLFPDSSKGSESNCIHKIFYCWFLGKFYSSYFILLFNDRNKTGCIIMESLFRPTFFFLYLVQ